MSLLMVVPDGSYSMLPAESIAAFPSFESSNLSSKFVRPHSSSSNSLMSATSFSLAVRAVLLIGLLISSRAVSRSPNRVAAAKAHSWAGLAFGSLTKYETTFLVLPDLLVSNW